MKRVCQIMSEHGESEFTFNGSGYTKFQYMSLIKCQMSNIYNYKEGSIIINGEMFGLQYFPLSITDLVNQLNAAKSYTGVTMPTFGVWSEVSGSLVFNCYYNMQVQATGNVALITGITNNVIPVAIVTQPTPHDTLADEFVGSSNTYTIPYTTNGDYLVIAIGYQYFNTTLTPPVITYGGVNVPINRNKQSQAPNGQHQSLIASVQHNKTPGTYDVVITWPNVIITGDYCITSVKTLGLAQNIYELNGVSTGPFPAVINTPPPQVIFDVVKSNIRDVVAIRNTTQGTLLYKDAQMGCGYYKPTTSTTSLGYSLTTSDGWSYCVMSVQGYISSYRSNFSAPITLNVKYLQLKCTKCNAQKDHIYPFDKNVICVLDRSNFMNYIDKNLSVQMPISDNVLTFQIFDDNNYPVDYIQTHLEFVLYDEAFLTADQQ